MDTNTQDKGLGALLMYDIPDDCDMENPSDLLRPLGLRTNLSVWLVPLKHIPLIPTDEWRAKGVNAGFVRIYDDHEYEHMLAWGKETLAKEIGSMMDTLNAGLATLRKELGAIRPGENEKYRKAKDRSYRQIKRAKDLANGAEEALLSFALMGEVGHLVTGLRKLVKARGEVYDQLLDEARKTAQGQGALPLAAGGAS